MDAEREHLYLSFCVYREGEVELLPTFHLGGLAPTPLPGKEWPMFCELLDEEERVVVSQRCYLRYPYYDPEGPFLLFNEVLPWVPGVRSIAFRLRGEEIHRVEIGEQAPEVRRLDWDRREEDRAQVSWDVNTPAEAPPAHHVLRYSNDGGNSWRVVMPPSTEPRYDLDMTLLPGGEDCRVQLVTSANIRTTTTETEPFAVPRKPREAYILALDQGDAAFTQGEPVLFMGSGFSPDFGTPDLEEMVWRSDVDGALGVGHQILAQTLSKGHHRITLTIPDGLGGEVSTGVDILVTGVGVL